MNFADYQKQASTTGFYDSDDRKYVLMYLCMGLAGESGEVIEKLKKVVRNDGGEVSAEKLELIKRELGDVLWYLSELSRELGLSLEEVAQANIEKLKDRKVRGVIKSEGDLR